MTRNTKIATTALVAAAFAATPVLADHHEGMKPNTGPAADGAVLNEIQPSGEGFDFAPDMDPQMQAVIEQFAASEPPMPITQLTPFQFRNATLPAGAVQELAMKTGVPAAEPKVDVSHKVLPVGPEEGLLARVYTPLDAPAGESMPTIVYYHGGGWVIADLDTYDAGARALAAKTGAQVVSVAYRQAPESPFPTAHRDAFAAYEYVVENIGDFGGDADKIATAGESAGGNLAVATALLARTNNVAMPAAIVSVYPVADDDTVSESYDQYANAMPLSRPLMQWFFDYYGPEAEGASSGPRELIDLVDANLEGLPPTTIINAQIDPLASDGEELAAAIEKAGGQVERKVYNGVTHEFFGMDAVLEQAGEAQDYAASRLKSAFGSASANAGANNAADRARTAGSTMSDDVNRAADRAGDNAERAADEAEKSMQDAAREVDRSVEEADDVEVPTLNNTRHNATDSVSGEVEDHDNGM